MAVAASSLVDLHEHVSIYGTKDTEDTVDTERYSLIRYCLGESDGGRGEFSGSTVGHVYRKHRREFEYYMRHAVNRSSSNRGLQIGMADKSIQTYLTTADKIFYKGSGMDVDTIEDFLEATTIRQFLTKQHLAHDKPRRVGAGQPGSNIFKPALQKFFNFLIQEAGKDGCRCDTCDRVKYLLLHPEEQGELQQGLCKHCRCGKHCDMFPDPNNPPQEVCRVCHYTKAGKSICMGTEQCMSCMDHKAHCNYFQMKKYVKDLAKSGQVGASMNVCEAVLSGKLFLCDDCFTNVTNMRAWLHCVRKPFERGSIRLERDLAAIGRDEIKDRQLCKEMRDAEVSKGPLGGSDDDARKTHKEAADTMQEEAETIHAFLGLMGSHQRDMTNAFVREVESIIEKMSSGEQLGRSQRDIVLSLTKYHLQPGEVVKGFDGTEVTVPRRKRRKRGRKAGGSI